MPPAPSASQPARAVLLDCASFGPYESEALVDAVCCALIEFVSVLDAFHLDAKRQSYPLNQPVSMFGFTMVGRYSEVLMPMDYVRPTETLGKLKICCQRARNLFQSLAPADQDVVIRHALSSVISQFKSASSDVGSSKCSLVPYSIEIYVYTLRPVSVVVRQLVEALDVDDRRIIVHRFGEPGPPTRVDTSCITVHEHLNESPTVSSVLVSLKSWLTSATTSYERIVLIFDECPLINPVTVKCDTNQPMLDPYSLRNPEQVLIHNDPHISSKPFLLTQQQPTSTVLRVSAKVHRSRVSPLFLYGQPLLLSATQSCTIPWDELERNRNAFNALLAKLTESQSCLVCKRAFDDSGNSNSSFIVFAPATNADLQQTPFMALSSLCNRQLWLPPPAVAQSTSSTNQSELIKTHIDSILQLELLDPLEN